MFDRSDFIKPSDIQSHLVKKSPPEEIAPAAETAGRLYQLKAACNQMLSLFQHYIWEVRITRQLNRNISVLSKELKEGRLADLYSLFEGVNQLKEVCRLLKNGKVSQRRLAESERRLDDIRNKTLSIKHLEGAEKLKEIVNEVVPREFQARIEEIHENLNGLLTSIVKNPSMKNQLEAEDYEVIRKWRATQRSSAEYTPAVLKALSKVINQDPELVIKYVPICFDVGCYYHFDEVNLIIAPTMYRLAAHYGHSESLCNLGYCFEVGGGWAQDLQFAAMCYRRAAVQGHVQALCNLAYFFEVGKGVEQNEKMAVQLYEEAATKGSARAQCNLGYCYAQGKGVDKDLVKAVALYELAAHQNYAQAQCNLAHCYEIGQGVAQDLAKAVELYRLAAEKGHAIAKEHLERINSSS